MRTEFENKNWFNKENERFTVIVGQRKEDFYRTLTRDTLFSISIEKLFGTKYNDIYHYWLLFSIGRKMRSRSKNLRLGFDRTGRGHGNQSVEL